ncbi:MAG: hypothetical protein KDA99_30785, partial [Planctomycetales bacterium]|nr:hypothetical protein [Planctomycetales bacterium]
MGTALSKRRIALNLASQWWAQLANTILSLLLIGYAVAKLGDTRFGGWTAIMSTYGALTMLDAGLS